MISKKKLAALLLGKSGLRALLAHFDPWTGVLCLNYHRIGDCAQSLFDRQVWSATAADFDVQMRFLKDNFEIIEPEDLELLRPQQRGRHVVVTFDDGYRDNYEIAFPILKAHGIRATFFLSTGFLDAPRLAAWDEIAWMVRRSPERGLPACNWFAHPVVFEDPHRERAVRTLVACYKQLPEEQVGDYLDFLAEATRSGRFPQTQAGDSWMTWDMVRTLRAAGMRIGGHTVNHPNLAQLPQACQRQEIFACAERLKTELDVPMTLFSYPFGDQHTFNEETRACLRDQGVQFAFSFYGGFRDFRRPTPWDPYDIPRLSVEKSAGLDVFRAKTTLPHLFA